MKPIYIILILLLTQCTPQQRIQRIAKKYNLSLIDSIIVRDTVIIQTYKIDTTTIIKHNHTTEVINNDRVRLQYFYDTLTREIWHEVECKGDTVYLEKVVYFDKIVVEESPLIKRVSWSIIGLLLIVGLVYALWKWFI